MKGLKINKKEAGVKNIWKNATVDLSGIQTRIVGAEGDHTDQFSTTTVHRLQDFNSWPLDFESLANSVWPYFEIKVAQIFLNLPKSVHNFFVSLTIIFQTGPKRRELFGQLFIENLWARTVKNRPIWSHCLPQPLDRGFWFLLSRRNEHIMKILNSKADRNLDDRRHRCPTNDRHESLIFYCYWDICLLTYLGSQEKFTAKDGCYFIREYEDVKTGWRRA